LEQSASMRYLSEHTANLQETFKNLPVQSIILLIV